MRLSSAPSPCAVLAALTVFAVLPLGAAWVGEQQPEDFGEDGASCVTEDDHPSLLQVGEHSVNTPLSLLPSESTAHPEPALALLSSNATKLNPDWFYPRWGRDESPLSPGNFDGWEENCGSEQCTNGPRWFTTGCGTCFCCHEDLIVGGSILPSSGVFEHPELAMKKCAENANCAAFTISKSGDRYYWFGQGRSVSKYRPQKQPGYMTCSKYELPCLGRPYMLEGQALAAQIPANNGGGGIAALERPGGWGATEPKAAGVGVASGVPTDLASRLLAEATRSAMALHEREMVEPLLALQGTVVLPEEELSELIHAARQELSGDDELSEKERGRWRNDGLSEHASVGTFAKLGIELMVAGAPPRLARLAARAQEEEVLHAHISLAVGGASQGGELLEFPEHDLKLARDFGKLRHAAIEEGLRGEGHAALKLFEQATQALATRPALARLCWAMAQDEARHAQLAEETLNWLHHATGLAPPLLEIEEGSVKVIAQ